MSVQSTDSRVLSPVGADLVWFSGPDAVRFLNDLISQEIGSLEPGRVRRSLLLGPQGKLDHILWALRGNDLVGLVADEGRGDELVTTLGRYRIRVKVEIAVEDRSRWVVFGGVTDGVWSGDPEGTLDADISWRGVPRRLIVGERPDLPEMTVEEYEVTRIRAGEPRWGMDVDGSTIPEEAGLVGHSVDFNKGCYLGQELVARIDSRGRVVKRLRILELSAPAPPGTPITVDNREVGTLTSVVGTTGLGILRFEVEPGDQVDLGGGVKARVVSLD